jgi:hypothetical protein
MELDELKSVLKARLEANAATRSVTELEQYVGRKATSVITKIKRNMIYEFILGALCMAVCVWAFYRYPSLCFRFPCVLAILICAFQMIYMIRLSRKISSFEKTSFSVKENIQQVLEILRKFTRIYFQLTIAMLLAAFLLGLVIGYLDVLQQGLANSFKWGRGILFYTGCYFLWTIFMYFFSKWYIKKLYGNYLEQLKAQLKDLENG